MSLRLVFSSFADAGAWPEHPGAGAAVVDAAVVGPMRLLDHIETMLGLGAPASAGVKRIAIYRRKLEACGGERFWSESFKKDSVVDRARTAELARRTGRGRMAAGNVNLLKAPRGSGGGGKRRP